MKTYAVKWLKYDTKFTQNLRRLQIVPNLSYTKNLSTICMLYFLTVSVDELRGVQVYVDDLHVRTSCRPTNLYTFFLCNPPYTVPSFANVGRFQTRNENGVIMFRYFLFLVWHIILFFVLTFIHCYVLGIFSTDNEFSRRHTEKNMLYKWPSM